MNKKSYVFVGAGQRCYYSYMIPMKEELLDYCELKGVYDINIGRAREIGGRVGIPVFDSFDEMLEKAKPDVVIVTTVDSYHVEYIVRALEAGCDVISEKPMTTDAPSSMAVIEAEKRTGKSVKVTFNVRYTPIASKLKTLLMEGVIGDVFSVHFEWMLDRNMDILAHGTSYFRRWNARMEKSGGLLVHKSTHHFDMLNWILNQKPITVSAFGKLNLYGTEGSARYADGISGKNCRCCKHADKCEFYYQLDENETKIYANNEKYDGYFKDGCVYAPDIDIYDTMSVGVLYDKGTLLSYSLNATCAYEGWRMSMNGSKGRLEIFVPATGVHSNIEADVIRIYDLDNATTEYTVPRKKGGHGGSDERIRHDLFIGDGTDPLGRRAGIVDGASSLIIGAAANISIKEGRTVNISELIELK